MSAADADRAILLALAPRDLAERLRLRLAGGFSARQVFDRLDEAAQAALIPPALARSAGELRAVERVAVSLRQLVARGLAERRVASLRVDMRVKGARAIEVDVFRRL